MSANATGPAGMASPPPAIPTAATDFLARTSGLDAAHQQAYINLISSLIANGVWSKFDVLYVFATQNAPTALLNLVSTNYNGTAFGSPTFLADRYYLGVDSSTTKYIDSNFNPSTASSPNYSQNAAHISSWVLNNDTQVKASVGAATASGGNIPWQNIITAFGGSLYPRVNVDGSIAGGGQAMAVPSGIGHFVGVRSDSTHVIGYYNGYALSNPLAGQTSHSLLNLNMYALGQNSNGSALGAGQQQAAVSFGGLLTAPDVGNFYSALRAFLTAVGVP